MLISASEALRALNVEGITLSPLVNAGYINRHTNKATGEHLYSKEEISYLAGVNIKDLLGMNGALRYRIAKAEWICNKENKFK